MAAWGDVVRRPGRKWGGELAELCTRAPLVPEPLGLLPAGPRRGRRARGLGKCLCPASSPIRFPASLAALWGQPRVGVW